MNRHTRRDFLKQTAVASGVLALGPLGWAAAQQAPAAQTGPAAMCIAHWAGQPGGYPDEMKTLATRLTEKAFAELGGMSRFVKQGHVVWIKPNIGWNRTPEQAANTNPDVVATLVRLCLEAGAKQVKVGDNSTNPAKQSYPNSGIEDAAKAAGAEVVYLDSNRFKEVAINGARLKKWELYPEVIECDMVINVPVAKHHSISTATLCMKNYMGIAGGERGQWHQDLPACLCDITSFMKPSVSVLDAVRILTANGPTGGNLADVKQLNIVAASTDIVALDAFGAELLGHEKGAIPTVTAAHAAGLGRMDYRNIALKEIEVS